MKKQGLLSFILTLVGTMWIATAGAQTKYNLKITGVEVTSANCNDLTVIPGIKGKVKYNRSLSNGDFQSRDHHRSQLHTCRHRRSMQDRW